MEAMMIRLDFVGHAGQGGSEASCRPIAMRQTACAALVTDGSDAGLGGELVSGREALADHAEFGEDLSDADPRQPSGKDMTLLLSRRSAIMCSMRLVILAISATRIGGGERAFARVRPWILPRLRWRILRGRGGGVRRGRWAIGRLQ